MKLNQLWITLNFNFSKLCLYFKVFYNDKVILDDGEKDIDIVKMELDHGKILDIDIIE